MLSRSANQVKKQPKLRLNPDFIADGVEHIDFEQLRQHGIKACLVDLDNTVVVNSEYKVSKKIRTALQQSGLKVYIATNRPKSRDLKNLKEDLGAQGVVHPHWLFGKPSERYFVNALKDMNLRADQVVMIGDHYLQDIFGANRAGIYSLLVKKLGEPTGTFDRVLSRTELNKTNRISKKYYSR